MFYCADGSEKRNIFKTSVQTQPPLPPQVEWSFILCVIVTSSPVPNPALAPSPWLAPVGMEALHVVVLPASEAAATSGGTPRARHRGAPVGGRLLAGVREALAKAAQVLPVTCWERGCLAQGGDSGLPRASARTSLLVLYPGKGLVFGPGVCGAKVALVSCHPAPCIPPHEAELGSSRALSPTGRLSLTSQ